MTTSLPHISQPKYRPDIDGLRAIAVLSVVAFHAFPGWMKGGFIGVDVFFVISGFLISTIVFENLDKGTFSFSEFYARRVKRIFPALLLVLIASYAFGWFALLADEYKQLGKHIAAGASFISNFALWSETGYFDNAAETKPLLHLWSLGIEEQFYLVWPFVLWLAWKGRFNLLTLTIIVATVSFVLNVNGIKNDPVATFYSPQTRFWELLSGSILAWFALYRKDAYKSIRLKIDYWLTKFLYRDNVNFDGKTISNVLSFLGFLLLFYGFFKINKTLSFPDKWAVVPVLGTVFIILSGPKAWINRTILSNKIAVWFGLISFPLYLWHWPLLSFARIVESEALGRNIRIAAVVLSVALAWLTYKFIERPIRFGRKRKDKVMFPILLMAITGIAGFKTFETDGLPSRVKKFNTISKAAGEWQYPGNLKPFEYKERTLLRQNSNRKEVTMFVGDSNIEQYYVRADELITSMPNDINSVIFFTGGGCLSIPFSPYDDERKHCINLMESALEYAKNDTDIKNVVIGSQWNGYLYHGHALKGKFGVDSKNYQDSLNRLSAYLKELKNAGKTVFLVLNIPTGKELDPKYMALRGLKYFPNFLNVRDGGLKRKSIDSLYGKIQDDLKKVAELNSVNAISPLDFLCNSVDCPSVDENNEPIYKDSAHLRPTYVRQKASFIDKVLIDEKLGSRGTLGAGTYSKSREDETNGSNGLSPQMLN